MKVMRLEDLEGHDVFEFTYDSCFQNKLNWQKSSVYVSEEDFGVIWKYISEVFNDYHYFGPQKVYIHEWNEIKNLALKSEHENKDIELILNFFKEIELWIQRDPQKKDFFWIWGI